MRSVRLRLLVLALAPLVLLMPLLLLIGMTRWTADYDKLLIANVESDLRIAEQYLATILAGTGNDLTAVSESTEFALVLGRSARERAAWFATKQAALGLDFLYYLPEGDALEAAAQWPIIAAGLDGRFATRIDVFGAADLTALSPDLAARARLPLIATEAAVPSDRTA